MHAYRSCLLALVASWSMLACGGDDSAGSGPQAPPPPPVGNVTPSFDPLKAAALTTFSDGTGAFTKSPQLAFSADGNALAVFRAKFDGQSAIVATRFMAGTGQFEDFFFLLFSVGAPQQLTNLRLRLNESSNAAVAVWTTEAPGVGNVFAAVYRDGVWQEPQNVSQLADSMAGGADAAFDAATGEPVVVWTQETAPGVRTTEYSRLRTGKAVWDPPHQVINLGTTWSHSQLRLVPLPQGDLMLVATENGPRPAGHGTGNGAYVALYRYSKGADTWVFGNQHGSAPNPLYFLPDAPEDGQVREFDLAVNAAGRIALAWAHEHPASAAPEAARRAIRLARFDPLSGAWSVTAESVDTPSTDTSSSGAPGSRSFFPRLVMNAGGNAWMTWAQDEFVGSGKKGQWTRRFEAATSGFSSAPRKLEGASGVKGQASVALDTQGNVMAVWAQSGTSTLRSSLHATYCVSPAAVCGPAVLAEANDVDAVDDDEAVAAFAPHGTGLALWPQGANVHFNRLE